MSKQQTLEIVERSSGFWVVDDCGVAWDQPFDSLDEALKKLESMSEDKENQISKCVLCGDDYRGWGNNPEPVKSFDDGQCCNSCNAVYVIPARLGSHRWEKHP